MKKCFHGDEQNMSAKIERLCKQEATKEETLEFVTCLSKKANSQGLKQYTTVNRLYYISKVGFILNN